MDKNSKTDTSPKSGISSTTSQPTINRVSISKETNDNRSLLTKEVIETALKNDLGQEAHLSTFQIKDFTKPGDNYSTLVTGIRCNGMLGKQEVETFYVAKVLNTWNFSAANQATEEFFLREGKFLTEIKIRLNKILDDLDEQNLFVADCIYQDHRKEKQILIMKDIRERGFRMFDRRVGVDVEHAVLVVKALARLHAAGFLLKKKCPEVSLLKMYPYLVDKWLHLDEIIKWIGCVVEGVIPLLENEADVEKASDWLRKNKERAMKTMFLDQLLKGEDKFKTICHGDIWITNMMFRYNEENRPEEVVLLDLQLFRVSSIVTDINYFLFVSMDAQFRRANIETILRSYYETTEDIVEKAGIKLEFSFEELKEEYANKCAYGVYMALFYVPLIMRKEEEVTDLSVISVENMKEVMEVESKKNQEILKKDPIFKSRLLGAFIEGIQRGVFD